MTPADALARLAALDAAATPFGECAVMRFNHGGGRVYVEGDERGDGRQLVADFFDAPNRECWTAARNALPALRAVAEAALAVSRAIEDKRSMVNKVMYLRAALDALPAALGETGGGS